MNMLFSFNTYMHMCNNRTSKKKSYRGTYVLLYYGHLEPRQKCPDYQRVMIFQVILCDKVPFGTTTECVDYAGVLIFQ